MSVTFSYLADAVSTAFTIGDPLEEVTKALVAKELECAPVLDDGRYVGMVSLSGLLRDREGRADASQTLGADMIEKARAYEPDEQLFDNLSAVASARCGIVPVVDEDERLEGVVSKSRVLAFLADRMHSGEGGYTLEIEVPPTGAKLSEVIETIEKNDASVLSFTSWPTGPGQAGNIIFFRLATHDFYRLIRNMEKYGYLIRYHSLFPEAGYDELREKALEFIRYMDM